MLPSQTDEQTLQRYKEALKLGQRALEVERRQAKPLPHIFGSAAYIQDPHAGLGSLPCFESNGVANTATEHTAPVTARETAAEQAQPAQQSQQATAAESTELEEAPYQPQNFKAMLEAALRGKTLSLSNLDPPPKLSSAEQHESSAQLSNSSRDRVQREAADMHASSSEQRQDTHAATDQPHVLAWLEKGRSLFDEDDE